MNEKVSIITASYNYENYIKETIESVINQTYQDWEMIIVDDGSQDNSVNVINSYCQNDNRIKLYQHENGINKGLAETLKLGIKKATGEWIVFLESDDMITSDYIEKKLEIIKKYPHIKFIFNDVNLFGDEEVVKKYQNGYFKHLYKTLNKISFPANIVKHFRKMNVVSTFSCVMLKKEILNDIDFNSKNKRCLDWYLWTQLAYKYDFYYINEKLTNWRMSKKSYFNNKTESDSDLTYFLKVQIPDIISGGKNHFLHKINFYLTVLRKNIIKVHLNKNEIILFDKYYIQIFSMKNNRKIKSEMQTRLNQLDSECKQLKSVLNYYLDNVNENLIKQHNKVIYTCITGNYDNLIQHNYIDHDYDYICFTDNKNLLSQKRIGIWQIRPLLYNEESDHYNNRWHKFFPHKIFNQYPESIYIDGNINILTNYIFDYINKNNKDLLLPKHYKNICLWDELDYIVKCKKDTKENIDKLKNFYTYEKFPHNLGFSENNIIYRKHNNKIMQQVMEDWWDMIKKYSCRDQASFVYVLWKNSLDISDYALIQNARFNNNFKIEDHIK